METRNGIEVIQLNTAAGWRNWLNDNHTETRKIWLLLNTEGSAHPTLTYDEAVDEAICYGWIDTKTTENDESAGYRLFGRRSPKRNWFTVNREKAERLIAEGRMMPVGYRTVEISQENGTWTALEEAENLEIPFDLQMAFDEYLYAEFNFEAFSPSVRRKILEWILKARTPHTRYKRIEETASMADKNIPATRFRKSIEY